MSRIGKRPIAIPAGTEVSVKDGGINVKGKAGTLVRPLHPSVSVKVENNTVMIEPAGKSRLAGALWGTYASHVRNMIAGVNTPFMKKLQVEGIGYRAELSGKQIKLQVGFSHPVLVPVPEGITVAIEKNVISISGPDKEQVGQFAADVRSIKKPEPYKGKGIRYEGEVIHMKQGKKAGAAA
ncbi:50S ribosomal protein L6 [Candidatus Parcubacteria bacterium]|nr:MAG: 50S ribosomal protein L6 [Candidatus Parcubacteria bacterium]